VAEQYVDLVEEINMNCINGGKLLVDGRAWQKVTISVTLD